MGFDDLEHVGWRRRASEEHRGPAYGKGEVQAIAEAVGKEELGHAEAAVALGDVEHATGIQIGADHHVAVQMDATLGEPGAARRIQPESGVVLAGWLSLELR